MDNVICILFLIQTGWICWLIYRHANIVRKIDNIEDRIFKLELNVDKIRGDQSFTHTYNNQEV
jgi:hypothetical protein